MSLKSLTLLVLCAISLVECEYYRLPKNVKPTRYHLTMEPHLQDDTDVYWELTTFNGTITIELEILETTNSITLHSKNLEIVQDNIEIVNNEGAKTSVLSTLVNKKHQTVTINTHTELSQGAGYNLTISNFTGTLGNGEGFFMAKYEVSPSLYRRIAVTHFEPTSARRAFPCFDEPQFKAPFIISLIRKPNYNSISNEGIATIEDLGNNRIKDTFRETPTMSTFTVAFAVSDFLSTDTIDGQRVLGRPSEIKKGHGEYPLHIAVITLKKLEEYTGINFPINKMEQFGVPSGYFFNHAMENYGLVIFGEEHLLRSNTSREEDIKRTTVYISHEFAHMWFGNLVTPVWWNHLWLSESFAAYFQYFMASQIKPDWQLMDQFLIDVVNKAMYDEQFSQAAPLNFEITHIGQYPPFHIMYEKGASIIRMMTQFLTPEVFRSGLHIYLNKMKFRNSLPSDLYSGFQQALDEAGKKHLLGNFSVSDIMTTWDSSKGFPTLLVTRDYKTGALTITQEDIFHNVPKKTWIVPITYVFSADGDLDFTSKTTADFWFSKETETLNNDYPTDGFLIVNKQQFGYYRVNYDIENWNRIINYINTENYAKIHPLNRAQLIDDAFNFAQNGKIPYDIPLRLCDYIIRERHYVPLVTFYEAVSSYMFIYIYGPNQEYKYFNNYTLTNTIAHNSSTTDYIPEDEVFTQYMKNTLRGVYEYYKNKPESTDSHLDKLGRAKFRRYKYYFN